MTGRATTGDLTPPRPAARMAERLRSLAFVILLLCLVSRTFISEVAFRTSSLHSGAVSSTQVEGQADQGPFVDRSELARVTFAVLLLAAGAIWLLAEAVGGRLTIRHRWFALLIGIFAVGSLASALAAADKRSAMNVWIEQLAILWAAFVAAQLCSDRRRFSLLVVVLVGVGAALAVKGLWQVFVEVPERVRDFELYSHERLGQFGWVPGTPQATMIGYRIRDWSAFGYFGLANIFGSLLIILFLAAGGLAADKLIAAIRSRKADLSALKRGDIHLPSLAAAVAVAMALLVCVVLAMTRSRGAIVAGAAAAIAAVMIFLFRRRLGGSWLKAVLVAAGVFALAAAGVVGYGLTRDRLPTKTMTFRWFYWTASAEMIRDNAMLGVGPGNFPSAYLRYRRAEGEEAVKMPHNVLVHAAAQFGLPGGLCYLAIVAYLLVGACKPPGDAGDLPPPPRQSTGGVIATTIALASAVFLARLLFAGLEDPFLIVYEAILPGVLVGVMLAAAFWTGGVRGFSPRACRIALACGVGGFVLHNMVTFSLWMPATATVFWLAGGACLAHTCRRPVSVPSFVSRPLAVAAFVAVAVVAVVFWLPTYRKTQYNHVALSALSRKDGDEAARAAALAATSDPLDAIAAADAAKLILSTCPRGGGAETSSCLRRAAAWARQAVERDPSAYSHRKLAAQIAWYLSSPDAHAYAWMTPAVQLDAAAKRLRYALTANPQNPLLLSDLAQVVSAGGDYDEATRLLTLALRLDGQSAALNGLLGDAAWRAGKGQAARDAWRRAGQLAADGEEALEHFSMAVKLNPMDLRLRVDYAEMLCAANRPGECLEQLRNAREIDHRLLPGSVMHFNSAERRDISLLEARATFLQAIAGGQKGRANAEA